MAGGRLALRLHLNSLAETQRWVMGWAFQRIRSTWKSRFLPVRFSNRNQHDGRVGPRGAKRFHQRNALQAYVGGTLPVSRGSEMSRKPRMHVMRCRPIFAFATQEESVSLDLHCPPPPLRDGSSPVHLVPISPRLSYLIFL